MAALVFRNSRQVDGKGMAALVFRNSRQLHGKGMAALVFRDSRHFMARAWLPFFHIAGFALFSGQFWRPR